MPIQIHVSELHVLRGDPRAASAADTHYIALEDISTRIRLSELHVLRTKTCAAPAAAPPPRVASRVASFERSSRIERSGDHYELLRNANVLRSAEGPSTLNTNANLCNKNTRSL